LSEKANLRDLKEEGLSKKWCFSSHD